jgi:hypothetical protein
MILDGIHEDLIRKAIEKQKFNDFQNFINNLMLEKCGNDFVSVKNSFVCVRQKKDKGCDGIHNNETILAVYAPEKDPDIGKFKRKVEEDYEKYVTNWEMNYPSFCFVYNGEYTSEMLLFIDKLNRNIIKCDINKILKLIKSMSWVNIRNVSNYLNIDERFFKYDILKTIVEDMMGNIHENRDPKNEKPSYIEDKIKLNYDEDDIEGALNQYSECYNHLEMLKIVLKPYKDSEISSLKSKIMTEYDKFSGNFKTRLNYLTELFAERNKDDDVYRYYVRVVLIYAFEICIIGRKTSDENVSSTT